MTERRAITTRATRSIDPEARIRAAAARLVSSPLSRALGSFFIGLHKPNYPTRRFTSELEVLAWLRGFLA